MRCVLLVVAALAGPPALGDAGVQNLDFSDDPELAQPVAPRDPAGVTFASTLPARFVLPDGGEPRVIHTRPRGGCAGCSAGGAADEGGAAGAAALLAAVLLLARATSRPARARRAPPPRSRALPPDRR